jgi:mannonate dehydratase
MKIRDARVIVCCPGRNYVTLRIETESGLSGIGDATVNGREMAVVAYLREHVVPCLIGRDAARIEDTWQFFYRGAYWRGGPIGMAAIAAVDVALWDIKAKAAGMPLYQLFGGASRDNMLCYAHARGADIPALLDHVAALRAQGFRAFRLQCGIPGLPEPPAKNPGPAMAADRPAEQLWDSDAYLRFAPRMLEAARAALGEETALLHDIHHRLTPIEASRLARAVEQLHLFWLEDPAPAENHEVIRLIRRASTTPLAIGEVFNSIHDCRELLQDQLIDYIRVTPVHAAGLTQVRRIADLAALWQIRTAFHGAADMSPVTFGAALHLGRAIANFGIQEFAGHPAAADDVFPHAWRYADGALTCGEAPGHGVTIDEAAAARFPYARAWLPVCRLADGTLWNY